MALFDTYQYRIYCYDSTLTQVGINTLYYAVSAETAGGVTQQAICNALDLRTAPLYKAAQAAGSIYYGSTLQKQVEPPGPNPVFSSTNANQGPGTIAGNNLPAQVSGLISLRTGTAGPRFRGRIYPPFPPSSASDADGKMTAAYQTLLQNLAAVLIANITVTVGGNSSTLFACMRTYNNVPPHIPFWLYTAIVRADVPRAFATQRRRGQFGRINALPF